MKQQKSLAFSAGIAVIVNPAGCTAPVWDAMCAVTGEKAEFGSVGTEDIQRVALMAVSMVAAELAGLLV